MKIIAFIFVFITTLLAQQSITWVKWDLAPNYILEGKLKDQGWADKRLKMLQEKLPQYQHDEVVMNATRFIKTFNKKDDSKTLFCTNDIISHPNMDFDDYLSIGYFPFMGYQLVTTTNKKHFFENKNKSVKLKDIIQNEKLKLVIAKDRPYLGAGEVVAQYLKKNPKQKHISILSTISMGKSMFESVIKDRADYTFEYDFRITYYAKELDMLNQMAFFPIEENVGVFYGFISCMKTQKGKKAIEEINTLLRELRTNQEWIKAFVEWLPTQERKNEYMRYYYDVFLKKGDIYDDNPRSR